MNLLVSTIDLAELILTSIQIAIFYRFINNHQHTIDLATLDRVTFDLNVIRPQRVAMNKI